MDLDSLYRQTAAAHRTGQLADAERGYVTILNAEPGYTQACYALGIVRAQQGRLEEALDLIGAAVLVTPHMPEMLFNYGNVLMAVGRFPEALAIFDRALDIEPANAGILATRAFLAANGTQAVTVPYRANRAVVFDSDLFHETDVMRFRDGYLNRRINVTLLYGDRA
jgi:tetratricopeptide (TPR) repeat protein